MSTRLLLHAEAGIPFSFRIGMHLAWPVLFGACRPSRRRRFAACMNIRVLILHERVFSGGAWRLFDLSPRAAGPTVTRFDRGPLCRHCLTDAFGGPEPICTPTVVFAAAELKRTGPAKAPVATAT